MIAGVRDGFRIGFDYGRVERSQSASHNMASVYEHPTVVSDSFFSEGVPQGSGIGALQASTPAVSAREPLRRHPEVGPT